MQICCVIFSDKTIKQRNWMRAKNANFANNTTPRKHYFFQTNLSLANSRQGFGTPPA